MEEPSFLDYANFVVSIGLPSALWAWLNRKNRELKDAVDEANAYAKRQEERAERLEDRIKELDRVTRYEATRQAWHAMHAAFVDLEMRIRLAYASYHTECRGETAPDGVSFEKRLQEFYEHTAECKRAITASAVMVPQQNLPAGVLELGKNAGKLLKMLHQGRTSKDDPARIEEAVQYFEDKYNRDVQILSAGFQIHLGVISLDRYNEILRMLFPELVGA